MFKLIVFINSPLFLDNIQVKKADRNRPDDDYRNMSQDFSH